MQTLISNFSIWSAPSRSMKVEYETRNHTASSIQVRFRFTYTLNSSSGYTSYSQSVDAYAGSTKLGTTSLKGSTPSSWYGDPIIKTTGWYTVSLSASATSITFKFTFSSTDPADSNVSKNGSIPIEPLLSILNRFDNNLVLNLEESLTLSITKYNNSYTNNLTLYYRDSAGDLTQIASWSNVEDGDSIQLNSTQLSTLYNLTTTQKFYSLTWELETFDGDDSLGSTTLLSSGVYSNAEPIFAASNFSYQDVNTTTLSLTNNNQIVISNYSDLQISLINPATAQKGATIDHYLVNDETVLPSEFPYTLKNKISISEITVYAVDSRSLSTLVTKDLSENFIDYVNLGRGNSSVKRDNGVSTQTKLNFSGTFWNGNFGYVDNDLNVTYKFKKTNDSAYTTGLTIVTPTKSGNNFNFDDYIRGDSADNGFNISDSYNIEVIVSDKLSSITYDNLILVAGSPAIAGYGNHASIGGDYDETIGGNQVWGDLFFNGKNICETHFEHGRNTPTQSYITTPWFQIASGKNAFEVSGNSNITERITFNKPFGGLPPHIVPQLANSTTNTAYCQVVVKAINQTTEYFDMQIINGASSGVLPGVAWIAVGQPATTNAQTLSEEEVPS